MADSTLRVKVAPEIDEEALRDAMLKLIAGHAVIRPGETLVIRCGGWTPDQADCYQEYLDHQDLPFRVLVVIGDGLAVAGPQPRVTVDVSAVEDAAGAVENLGRPLAEQARTRGATVSGLLA